MSQEIHTDVLILGAGSAGMYALREVRRAGRDFRLVDRGPLGTTCARVGCMPSKVALHLGAQWAARQQFAAQGILGAEALQLDRSASWQALRRQRDAFSGNARDRAVSAAGDKLIKGSARFLEPTLVAVSKADGEQRIRARSVIIATGSRPVLPGWLEPLGNRVLSTDDLFELEQLPQRIGILGLGAIGLEMGLALSRLGIEVVGADLASWVGGIVDPVLGAHANAVFGREFELWTDTASTLEAHPDGVLMRSDKGERVVERVLAALGRRPNVDELELAAAGLPLDERGTPLFDPHTLQIGDLPVYIAGDANAERALMHEAADEGAIAGYNAAREQATAFARKTSLGIAFSNPDIVSVGQRLDALPADVITGTASGKANGRARIIGGEDSLIHLYADAGDGRLLGAAMLAHGGEHLAHLLAWAIQRGETASSLLSLPFYHPVLEEMLQSALQHVVTQLPAAAATDYPFGLQPVTTQR